MQTFKPAVDRSSGKTDVENLSSETVKETRSCQNELRVALRGMLKNLVLVKFDKRMIDHLIEQGTIV